tara:strand:+ start:124 stop:447 length:324 start_codon:yes stop_codon:yes gene_type:complete
MMITYGPCLTFRTAKGRGSGYEYVPLDKFGEYVDDLYEGVSYGQTSSVIEVKQGVVSVSWRMPGHGRKWQHAPIDEVDEIIDYLRGIIPELDNLKNVYDEAMASVKS